MTIFFFFTWNHTSSVSSSVPHGSPPGLCQQHTTYKEASCDLRQHCHCDDAVAPLAEPKGVETALRGLLRAVLIASSTLPGTWQQLLPQQTQPLRDFLYSSVHTYSGLYLQLSCTCR